MDETERNLTPDGFVSLEGGMDAGNAPPLLPRNKVALAVNTTFRGGFASCRPGWVRRDLDFNDQACEDAFTAGTDWFQGAGAYTTPGGIPHLICGIGGRIYRIKLDNLLVTEITPPDGMSNPNRPQVWIQQAEDWVIVQDGQTAPTLYNGASSRRSIPTEAEVPIGTCMAYGMGRLWVAGGRFFVAGDIVGGASGTLAYGFRDAVLKFVENTYILEGGNFGVPLQNRDITAMRFIAQLNTALGQGELIISTANSVFSMIVPQDRETWKTLSEPIMRVAQIGYGATGANALALVNGDLFYRAKDRSIRSLVMAIRDFTQWGNAPISNEIASILRYDDRNLLQYCSAENFDNRALVTISPYRTPVGIAHRGLSIINFDLISSLGGKLPPAWEGVWTGLNILQIVKAEITGQDRLYALAVNSSDEIELWELDPDVKYDDGDIPIQWHFESRGFTWDQPFRLKRLEGGDVHADELEGTVDFSVHWKPSQSATWSLWNSWSVCATVEGCDKDACATPSNLKPQARLRMPLPEPPNNCTNGREPDRDFYDAQFRVTVTGPARLKQMRMFGRGIVPSPQDPCAAAVCAEETACDESLFGYSIEEEGA